MNEQQTVDTSTEIEPTPRAVVHPGPPNTTGYVPIVGVPGNPSFNIGSGVGTVTEFSVSALSGGLADQSGPVSPTSTAACTVTLTASRQYVWSNNQWVQVSTNLPFSFTFSLNAPVPIANNQQLALTFSNATTGQAKLELDYSISGTNPTVTGTVAFARSS